LGPAEATAGGHRHEAPDQRHQPVRTARLPEFAEELDGLGDVGLGTREPETAKGPGPRDARLDEQSDHLAPIVPEPHQVTDGAVGSTSRSFLASAVEAVLVEAGALV
jgi:hypothetical protein